MKVINNSCNCNFDFSSNPVIKVNYLDYLDRYSLTNVSLSRWQVDTEASVNWHLCWIIEEVYFLPCCVARASRRMNTCGAETRGHPHLCPFHPHLCHFHSASSVPLSEPKSCSCKWNFHGGNESSSSSLPHFYLDVILKGTGAPLNRPRPQARYSNSSQVVKDDVLLEGFSCTASLPRRLKKEKLSLFAYI